MKSTHRPTVARCRRWLRLALVPLACCGRGSPVNRKVAGYGRPSTEVSVIHVAGRFGSLEFRRVERLEGTLNYRSSQVFTWDSGPYTFNIDSSILGSPIRLYSFEADLAAGNDYSIVLTEANGWLHELILEGPEAELSETEAEIIIVNTAAGLQNAVDVYIEPPGTVLAAATPRGAVDFLESIPVAAIAPGGIRVEPDPGRQSNQRRHGVRYVRTRCGVYAPRFPSSTG